MRKAYGGVSVVAVLVALLLAGLMVTATPALGTTDEYHEGSSLGPVVVFEVNRPNKPNLTCYGTNQKGVIGCEFEK